MALLGRIGNIKVPYTGLKFYEFIIIVISILVPKNKKYWVFGSRLGNYYNDNSRYLFEYVINNHKEIKACWVTQNRKVYTELKTKGYPVALFFSLSGLYHSIRSLIGIVSVVTEDVNSIAMMRAKIIQLWHAIQIKGWEDGRYNEPSENPRLSERIRLYLNRFNYVFVSSENQRNILSWLLNVQRSRIKITGFPKTDVLFKTKRTAKRSSTNISDFTGLKIPMDKRIVFYLPTFRDKYFNKVYDLFHRYDFNFESFEKLLRRHDAVLIIMPHYHLKVDKKLLNKADKSDTIFMYNSSAQNFDPNSIHQFIDILLTDFSSIYINFLIQDRPIIFTPFDYDFYTKEDSHLAFDYSDVTPGPKAYNWNEVRRHLDDFLSGKDMYKSDRKRIRNMFFKFQDGKSSERAVAEIKRIINFK